MKARKLNKRLGKVCAGDIVICTEDYKDRFGHFEKGEKYKICGNEYDSYRIYCDGHSLWFPTHPFKKFVEE